MDRLISLLFVVALSCGIATAQIDPEEPGRFDPDVLPIQYATPMPRPMPGAIADPAVPNVRIQVRTLAALAPGKPLAYRFIVTNSSSAVAYKVVVRHPKPTACEGAPTMEPAGTPFATKIKDVVDEYQWRFEELKPGTTKEIVVTYAKLDPKATSIKGTAFVSFEHGQSVITEIEKPKLSVRKVAPESAMVGDSVAIRVEVHNNGAVPVPNVKLTENNDGEYVADGDSEKSNVPGQRVWNLGTIPAGQSKFVEYRVRGKGAIGQLASTSIATGDGVVSPEPAQATVKLLTAKTQLDLVGPETVDVDGTASYVAGVTNVGTMPLSRVRLVAVIPRDCTIAGMTVGGQRDRERGQIVWEFAPTREEGPLKPGQRYEVRFKLKCATSGVKKITVDSDAGRGLEESRSTTTSFRGAATLTHATDLQPGIIVVGQSGLVTFTVANRGNAVAKNVTLTIKHDNKIDVKELSPTYTAANGVVRFAAIDIPADGQVKFSLTYKALTPGRTEFEFTLAGEPLKEPLRVEKSVTVNP